VDQMEADLNQALVRSRNRAPSETDNARAYASLKQAVLAGAFKPGEILTLRALANRLVFGDTPVREAVKRLISEGAFEGLPNRSARVPLLDRREIQQILDLRILLESNAAALAAQNITLHQIEQLRSLHKAMGSAVAVDDSQEYGELNRAFHFEIYRIADNKTLARLIEALSSRATRRRPGTLPAVSMMRCSLPCRAAMRRPPVWRCARICPLCRESTAIGKESRIVQSGNGSLQRRWV
jgi:DNA-binding GntR family transcriptional regulator